MAVTKMTSGNIFRHLISYSVPLILGNLFQLAYNAADSAIVGRFIGREALASVGSAAPVMNILILGISGITIGASVLMSEFFGSGEEDLLKKELATVSVFGLLFSLTAVIAGFFLSRPLLRVLRVPEEILSDTTLYLRIIFLGAPFTYFYNALSAAFKSVGDSKTPLRFLTFSSLLNAALDIFLIGFLGFGILCSALTTVIAEAVSAVLCLIYLYRKVPLLRVAPSGLRIEPSLLKKTLAYGGITALQQSCQPVGKLLIQGAVNAMGVDAIAAFNAASRIDDFAFTPEQSIANGITTFTAQNRGAGKQERIRKGFFSGLCLEFIYWAGLCLIVTLSKRLLIQLFVGAEAKEMIALGSDYLRLMAIFYLFPAATNGFQGYFRGMGRMKVTLLGTLIQTSLRVIFVFLLTPLIGIRGIAYACAIGWAVMLLFEVPYYFYTQKTKPAVK